MFHLLSLRGAEVIFAPHANTLKPYGGNPDGWSKWRLERWPLFVKDTCVCVAGINNAGLFEKENQADRNNYCGGGMVMDQSGKVLGRISGKVPREKLLMQEIDLESLRRERRANSLMQDFQGEIIYRRKDLPAWRELREEREKKK
jgi:predicted amidohydrolase